MAEEIESTVIIEARDGRVDIQIGDSVVLQLAPESAERIAFHIMEAADAAMGTKEGA